MRRDAARQPGATAPCHHKGSAVLSPRLVWEVMRARERGESLVALCRRLEVDQRHVLELTGPVDWQDYDPAQIHWKREQHRQSVLRYQAKRRAQGRKTVRRPAPAPSRGCRPE